MLEKQQQPEACIVINDACDLDVVEPFTITLLQIYCGVSFENFFLNRSTSGEVTNNKASRALCTRALSCWKMKNWF